MVKYNLALISLLILAMASCHKHDEHNHDDHNHTHTKTVIKILSPADGSSHSASNAVEIHAVLTNTSGVHHYQLSVTNLTTNETPISIAGHSHDNRVELIDRYSPDLNSAGNLVLNVKAFDHEGNVNSSLSHHFSVSETGTAKPRITLTSPDITQFYKNGDTLFISGMVTHNAPLREFRAFITKNDVKDFEFYTDSLTDNNYSFNLYYPIRVNDHTDFALRIDATSLDGNLSRVKRSYHVHP